MKLDKAKNHNPTQDRLLHSLFKPMSLQIQTTKIASQKHQNFLYSLTLQDSNLITLTKYFKILQFRDGMLFRSGVSQRLGSQKLIEISDASDQYATDASDQYNKSMAIDAKNGDTKTQARQKFLHELF